jgi:RimJ/RimL family protein N-acetyltransferase
MKVEPVTLSGKTIRLEPLSQEHFRGLCDAGLADGVWRWALAVIDSPEKMQAYLSEALLDQAKGAALPFATIDRASAAVIGCTRFGNIDTQNRKVEIGWTWLTPTFQRTYANTEAKYLMLEHAFEIWKCLRVELKTDSLNERSRNAILRIGAKEEGTLRQHMISQGGRLRDSVYFSIIDKEWPAVRERLRSMMDRP